MGVRDPDFPAITAAQQVWQGNYLPQIAAQVAGIQPEFSGDDNVYTIDRVTGIPFLPTVSEFEGGSESGVQSIVAGSNITVDDTDPQNPIISSTGGGGGGGLTPVLETSYWDAENEHIISPEEWGNWVLAVPSSASDDTLYVDEASLIGVVPGSTVNVSTIQSAQINVEVVPGSIITLGALPSVVPALGTVSITYLGDIGENPVVNFVVTPGPT